MKLNSIRVKTLLILIPLVILPILLVGTAGTLFYRDVIRQNIWDDNMAQARAITALTSNYMDLSENYLNSIAARPLVISSVEERNQSFLNVHTVYAAVESIEFDSVFVTDAAGKVLSYSSMYPDNASSGEIGKAYSGQPYVSRILATSGPYVSDGMRDPVSGRNTVFVGVPIIDANNTTIGTIVGTLDMRNLTGIIVGTLVKNSQYIYLVNRTGHVMIHSNVSYMSNMTDFSDLPAVQQVISGHEGIGEQYLPFENDARLVAYAPVNKYGWGVIVSLPVEVAYQPINQTTSMLVAVMLALMIITALIAYWFGNYIVGPIIGVSTATKKMINGGDYQRFLPLGRNDEIGELARSFDGMSRRIEADKERITDEKTRTELYVDIMGHDINNLNQSAMANLELIEDDQNLTDDERNSVSSALSAVRGSAGIIDNVRKIQQINEERIDVVPEDVNALLEACIRDAPRPPGKKVVINYTPRAGLTVPGNPLLKEAFCNLIGNSIKYSGDEVTVDIEVNRIDRAAGPFYEVVVEDDGHGIRDDVKPKLFQRFQRGTTRAHGKGLGLYIVRSLVDKLGGSVRVEDRVPGDHAKGAKFVVTLPAYAEGGDGREQMP
jgi:two-component system, sensor histidine kinase